MFTCYTCGTSICGEEKYRKKTNGLFNHHIYYHCTRSRNPNCRQPFITEKDLIKQIKLNIQEMPEEILLKSIPSGLQSILGQLEPIVKEISSYVNPYEYDDVVKFKDIVLYASSKAQIATRRDLINYLPIPKKLHNLDLV